MNGLLGRGSEGLFESIGLLKREELLKVGPLMPSKNEIVERILSNKTPNSKKKKKKI